MIIRLLMAICTLLIVKQAAAQPLIRCGHNAILKHLQEDKGVFSQYQEAANLFEQHLHSANNALPESDTLRIIPVVVHIMHHPQDVNPGLRTNISEAQIRSQIAVLNEDFGRIPNSRGFNTDNRGANTRFQFCLATIDPDGNATNGIRRVAFTNSNTFQISEDQVLKNNQIWPPNKYLNIWVVGQIFDGNDRVLGYTFMPSMVTNEAFRNRADGLVIAARNFGSIEKRITTDPPFFLNPPYNLGRTASHEIGHYLNLLHTWGDGGCNVDDLVDDTPLCADPFYGCSTSPVISCGNTRMIQNYMDYSDDACFNIFTAGQSIRMQQAFNFFAFRNNLSSPQNLTATGCLAQIADSMAITRGKFQTILINNNLNIIPEVAVFDLQKNGMIATAIKAHLVEKPLNSLSRFDTTLTTAVNGRVNIPFLPDAHEGMFKILVSHQSATKGTPDTIQILVQKDLSKGNKYVVYPNPFNSNGSPIALSTQMQLESDLNIRVFNVFGALVAKLKIERATSNPQYPLGLEHLSAGSYVLEIESNIDKKIIKFIKL